MLPLLQVVVQTGHSVCLVAVNRKILNKADERIKNSHKQAAKKKFEGDKKVGEKFVEQTFACIEYFDDPITLATTSDLVIKAIVENMEAKKELLFSKLDQNAPRYTLFVSNTSSLLISEPNSSESEGEIRSSKKRKREEGHASARPRKPKHDYESSRASEGEIRSSKERSHHHDDD